MIKLLLNPRVNKVFASLHFTMPVGSEALLSQLLVQTHF